MLVLSVDSSSKCATAALIKDDLLLAEYTLNNKREHSVLLMGIIQKLLDDSGITIDDVDGFVVSKGPGSFTGLRIGMATIKGLSFGSNKPYVSVSTLEGLAFSVSSFDGIICPIMDALRENVYTAIYRSKNGKLETIVDCTSMELSELKEKLNELGEKVMFTGDGVYKHKDYLIENIENASFAPIHLNTVRASQIGEIGLNLLKNGIKDDDNSSPLYLKQPQAVRELEKRLQMNNGESNS
ncbi:tRNA (adenosine(37)-N6)-threonylcarbamoyltransferase complex dimerization subunit type 1 TsaB [Clostridium sp.]|uniref:tRNA (adenosine(37)-N6)-threonylcarbamoyltransferase complex dimerization subunit type 1 TsaB n=1 Tax=Clostridium sp. TaxID=1506 RepID=UPI002A910B21|nr:tRNA (adenosine(37)-N6)-threonylcarbamoyltransferase complex dimerization subunit type 1 TsaB [Clostridium sp.]MDY6011942.1 tRNA (adenosine(37)-N6)-threonylcarbamoyltransferase complex dimerization subunit type 1 TsaB [Clostridium sp.]